MSETVVNSRTATGTHPNECTILLIDTAAEPETASPSREWIGHAIDESNTTLKHVDLAAVSDISTAVTSDVHGIIILTSPSDAGHSDTTPTPSAVSVHSQIPDSGIPILQMESGADVTAMPDHAPEENAPAVTMTLHGMEEPLLVNVPSQFSAASAQPSQAVPPAALHLAHRNDDVVAWRLPNAPVYNVQFGSRPLEAAQSQARQPVGHQQQLVRNFIHLLAHGHQQQTKKDRDPPCLRSLTFKPVTDEAGTSPKPLEQLQALEQNLTQRMIDAVTEPERWRALCERELLPATDKGTVAQAIQQDMQRWLATEHPLPSPAVSRWLLLSGIAKINLDPDWTVNRQKYAATGLRDGTGPLADLLCHKYFDGRKEDVFILDAGSGNNSNVHNSTQETGYLHYGLGDKLYVPLEAILEKFINVSTYSPAATHKIIRVVTTALQVSLLRTQADNAHDALVDIDVLDQVFSKLADLKTLFMETGIVRSGKPGSWSEGFPTIAQSDEFMYDGDYGGLRIDKDVRVCVEVIDWLEKVMGCEPETLKTAFLHVEATFLQDEIRMLECTRELIDEHETKPEIALEKPLAEGHLYMFTGYTLDELQTGQGREKARQIITTRLQATQEIITTLQQLSAELKLSPERKTSIEQNIAIPELVVPPTAQHAEACINPAQFSGDYIAMIASHYPQYATAQECYDAEVGPGAFSRSVRMYGLHHRKPLLPWFTLESVQEDGTAAPISISDVCTAEFTNAVEPNADQTKSSLDLREHITCFPRQFIQSTFGPEMEDLPRNAFGIIVAQRSDSHLPDEEFYANIERYLQCLQPGGCLLTDGCKQSYTRFLRLVRSADEFTVQVAVNVVTHQPVSLVIQRTHAAQAGIAPQELAPLFSEHLYFISPEDFLAQRHDCILADETRRALLQSAVGDTNIFEMQMHEALDYVMIALLPKVAAGKQLQENLDTLDIDVLLSKVHELILQYFQAEPEQPLNREQLHGKTFFEVTTLIMENCALDTNNAMERSNTEMILYKILLEALHACSQGSGAEPRSLTWHELLTSNSAFTNEARKNPHLFSDAIGKRSREHLFQRLLLAYRERRDLIAADET